MPMQHAQHAQHAYPSQHTKRARLHPYAAGLTLLAMSTALLWAMGETLALWRARRADRQMGASVGDVF
jgi:hypothetical protein